MLTAGDLRLKVGGLGFRAGGVRITEVLAARVVRHLVEGFGVQDLGFRVRV